MTKIICTLGPASSKANVLLAMMRAGMNVVRLNFSHGELDDHIERIRLVRNLNKKYRKNVKILGDLEGHRIRVGRMKGGEPVQARRGQLVWLVPSDILGSGSTIPFDFRGSLDQIKPGRFIYIDDGHIALRAEGRDKKGLRARVIVGGLIKERKGINLPDVHLDFEGLTPKDRLDIGFCAENKIDLLAQSFVRTQKDIAVVKEMMKSHAYRCPVIAKIENREGIKNIDDIIRVSDGIMVARGDMGVSLPFYEVPLMQKRIIRKCNRSKKFVVTATQMLESMITNLIPTRAEVSDVANAILDGSDYVMLSAETAVGMYPADCVDVMRKIIIYTEKNRLK